MKSRLATTTAVSELYGQGGGELKYCEKNNDDFVKVSVIGCPGIYFFAEDGQFDYDEVDGEPVTLFRLWAKLETRTVSDLPCHV